MSVLATLLTLWTLASIPAGILLGKFIRFANPGEPSVQDGLNTPRGSSCTLPDPFAHAAFSTSQVQQDHD
ncbi:hypothetical protein HNO88_000287 [Novosphingobium chloroacetimidivorans]|uniref:Uncharacterized protein n=1 Tax=Novosphingobium chloroacetimidivorans TaxID=1428314 RepID=A0A7W7K668_9SPHN|nr:hypothetical protein [Novosphingobium chloroacetimidivorans]MBB4856990.1 hypothetical protein [Novosphingobium chloroacetimidivorans]